MIRLIELDVCESTNDEAWKRLPETTLVVAKHQTRGRGRQGRHWEGEEGNLMASLAIVPPTGLITSALWIPLAAGVAAAEAIERVAGRRLSGLRLKWPNDVYWEYSKLGGLLCESRVSGDQLSGLVVGFGLNVARSPNVSELPVTCLKEHLPELAVVSGPTESDAKIDARSEILARWGDRVLFWIEQLAVHQHSGLRQKWLEHAKLKEFSSFTSHDRDGNAVTLNALDLEENGKLKATINSKVVYLDQPLP